MYPDNKKDGVIEKQKTILVVDDDRNIVRFAEVLLEKNGFSVITANDGSYALEKVLREKPDLVLLDIDMPEMNGFEVLERMKQNPATKRIPVIMLTARSDAGTFEKAVENDADRYVSKPFDNKFLLEKIQQVLEEYEEKYR